MRQGRTRSERATKNVYMQQDDLKRELEQQAQQRRNQQQVEKYKEKQDLLRHYENYQMGENTSEQNENELLDFLIQKKTELEVKTRQMDTQMYQQFIQEKEKEKEKNKNEQDYVFVKEEGKVMTKGELDRLKRLRLRDEERQRRLLGQPNSVYEQSNHNKNNIIQDKNELFKPNHNNNNIYDINTYDINTYSNHNKINEHYQQPPSNNNNNILYQEQTNQKQLINSLSPPPHTNNQQQVDEQINYGQSSSNSKEDIQYQQKKFDYVQSNSKEDIYYQQIKQNYVQSNSKEDIQYQQYSSNNNNVTKSDKGTEQEKKKNYAEELRRQMLEKQGKNIINNIIPQTSVQYNQYINPSTPHQHHNNNNNIKQQQNDENIDKKMKYREELQKQIEQNQKTKQSHQQQQQRPQSHFVGRRSIEKQQDILDIHEQKEYVYKKQQQQYVQQNTEDKKYKLAEELKKQIEQRQQQKQLEEKKRKEEEEKERIKYELIKQQEDSGNIEKGRKRKFQQNEHDTSPYIQLNNQQQQQFPKSNSDNIIPISPSNPSINNSITPKSQLSQNYISLNNNDNQYTPTHNNQRIQQQQQQQQQQQLHQWQMYNIGKMNQEQQLMNQILQEKNHLQKIALEEQLMLEQYRNRIKDIVLEKIYFEKEIQKLKNILSSNNPNEIPQDLLNEIQASFVRQQQQQQHINNINYQMNLPQVNHNNMQIIQNETQQQLYENHAIFFRELNAMTSIEQIRQSLPSISKEVLQENAQDLLEQTYKKDLSAFQEFQKKSQEKNNLKKIEEIPKRKQNILQTRIQSAKLYSQQQYENTNDERPLFINKQQIQGNSQIFNYSKDYNSINKTKLEEATLLEDMILPDQQYSQLDVDQLILQDTIIKSIDNNNNKQQQIIRAPDISSSQQRVLLAQAELESQIREISSNIYMDTNNSNKKQFSTQQDLGAFRLMNTIKSQLNNIDEEDILESNNNNNNDNMEFIQPEEIEMEEDINISQKSLLILAQDEIEINNQHFPDSQYNSVEIEQELTKQITENNIKSKIPQENTSNNNNIQKKHSGPKIIIDPFSKVSLKNISNTSSNKNPMSLIDKTDMYISHTLKHKSQIDNHIIPQPLQTNTDNNNHVSSPQLSSKPQTRWSHQNSTNQLQHLQSAFQNKSVEVQSFFKPFSGTKTLSMRYVEIHDEENE